MDPQRFARIKEILLAAQTRLPGERAAFLDDACGDDAELRLEVESLLSQEEAQASILEPGRLADRVSSDLVSTLDGAGQPMDIGPYHVVEVLGEGGMGVVYRAHQTRPIERDVALKLIKWGMDTARVVARFETERQTLASLDHPSIAKVLDAGADDRGRPYFVMELVQGEAITRFADGRCLTVPQRLELVLEVCRAVQHAHQRGVIHRDLKPSNILVSDAGDRWLVKVIDFGIAKAVGEPGEGATMTQAGQVVGTPQYMSPEQAGIVKGGVDTRTDVYSMGVLLYELLTGHQPLKFDTFSQLEILKVLEESEPRRPSRAVTQVEEVTDDRGQVTRRITPDEVGAARGTTVARLKRELSGDLENIIQMAMRKEPDQRYASMDQLAEDLVRYRDGMPVRACKPTFRYRAGKFVRRHSLSVALAAAAALTIVGFIITTAVQSARVARERDRAVAAEQQARRKAETAQRTSEFMVELFEISDPNEAKGSTVTAREILDRGAQRIRGELAEEPEVRAGLMDAIGRVYHSLGLWSSADTLLHEALATRRELLGEDHLDTAESMANLAFLFNDQDRLKEAEPLLRQVLAVRSAQLDETDERVTSSRFALAGFLQRMGRLDAAEEEFRRVLEIERVSLGENHPYVAMDLNNLASVHSQKDELEEAEKLYRESLAINLATGGPDHPETATNYSNISSILMRRGEIDSALAYSTHALKIRQKAYGEEHPHVAISLNIVAGQLNALGRVEEAEEFFRRALAMRRRLQGDHHPQVAHNLMGLGGFLSKQGRHGEAVSVLEEAVSISRAALPSGHTDTARTLHELGMAQLRWGKPAVAEALLWQALEFRRRGLPENHRETLSSLSGLGSCYLELDRLQEAEPLLLEALKGLQARFDDGHRQVLQARELLVQLYETQGDEQSAARYRPSP